MYTIVLSFLLLTPVGAYSRTAVHGPASQEISVQDSIVTLTYNCRFGAAMKLASRLDPGKATSLRRGFLSSMIVWREYIYKGGTVINDTALLKSFRARIRRVVKTGKHMLSENPKDTTALFYTGAALGYLGQVEAMSGKYFTAASDGSKALDYHKKLLAICPDWSDAYLTLGLFNFYASSVPWYLEPILFILGKSGSEKKAYSYLRMVASHGTLARYEAREMLARLYARDSKYDSVIAVYNRLACKFPLAYFYYQGKLDDALSGGKRYRKAASECRTMIDTAKRMYLSRVDSSYVGMGYVDLAFDYERMDSLQEAIRTYEQLVHSKIAPRFLSWAYLSLGSLYEKEGKDSDAILDYRRVVKMNEVPQHVKKARGRLEALGAGQ